MFTIQSLTNQGFVSGKLTKVTKFLVVDDKGESVLSKFFDTEAEAQAEIDGLGNYAEGLAFAKAKFPDMAEKALKAKAGVIADYITWNAAGRPVTEAAPAPEAAPEASEAAPAEPEAAPVSEEEEF